MGDEFFFSKALLTPYLIDISRYFCSSQTSPVQDRAPKILFFSLALFEARYLWVSTTQVTSECLSNLRVKYGAPAIRNPSGPPHHAPRLRRKNAKFWEDEKILQSVQRRVQKKCKKCKILPPVQRTVQKKCKKIQNSATCAEDGAKKCKILPPVQRTVLLSEVGMGFSRSGFGIDIHSCLRTKYSSEQLYEHLSK